LTASKHIESQAATKPANDVAHPGENLALVQFSLQCNSEPHQTSSEARRSAEKNDAPIKLFLERMGEASLSSDKNILKSEGQAQVAWNKVFQPDGFGNKKEAVEIPLCLEENIYT
jgi:hypothetical protein